VVSMLFGFAEREGYYDVGLGNGIVETVAKISADFRPDAVGLFLEYFSAARSYALHIKKALGPWFLEDRDDGHSQCWRSWQLAWVLSRGGLANAVGALWPWLECAKPSEQIAALALLADVADYVVQPELRSVVTECPLPFSAEPRIDTP